MSYWLNKAPSVGASGAIFGLVSPLEMSSSIVQTSLHRQNIEPDSWKQMVIRLIVM